MPSMTNHWEHYHRHWNLLNAPLRPPAETVGIIEREAATADADVLLLGVTPELAGLGKTMRAVDSSPGMISALWKASTPAREAVVGSWFDLPLASGSVDAVIGDGSLNSLGTSAERLLLLREMVRVLRPEGRAAIRVFASPGRREGTAAIRQDVRARRIDGFHAFKWRIAMTLAGPEPDYRVRVTEIRDTIDELFPDRAELSAATGWRLEEIGTIDAYLKSDAIYSFATTARLVEEAKILFEDVRLVPSGLYSLAERCPVLVMRQIR
jgi:SAM-dependent methyltransferase